MNLCGKSNIWFLTETLLNQIILSSVELSIKPLFHGNRRVKKNYGIFDTYFYYFNNNNTKIKHIQPKHRTKATRTLLSLFIRWIPHIFALITDFVSVASSTATSDFDFLWSTMLVNFLSLPSNLFPRFNFWLSQFNFFSIIFIFSLLFLFFFSDFAVIFLY